MADPRPPLSQFDDGIFERVAADTDLTADRLREITASHQEGVRDLPGVDDIVYEWRTQFHMDPLVTRSKEAYVLALDGHVWEEFADRLDLSDAEFEALRTVHDRQARKMSSTTGRFDDADALVLVRP